MNKITIRKSLRLKVLDTVFNSETGHLGGSLSALDFIQSLYNSEIRDFSFVLSKGHASLALYSVLDTIDPSFNLKNRYGKLSSIGDLHGHVSKKVSNSITLSCGSLGHGLPFSVGLAVSNKLNSKVPKPVICLLGDGECQEGTTWESILLLKKYSSSSILVVIDNNSSQQSYEGFQVSSIIQMFQDLSYPVKRICGHNIASINSSFSLLTSSNCPMLLVLDTIKGYGIPSIHSIEQWHAGKPTHNQYLTFKEELITFKEEY